jgi:hypothetical protein
MARTVKRLFGPAQVATGPATVYTSPALTKTRIKFLWVNNPSAGIVTLTVSVGADAAGTRLLDAYNIPAKGAGVTDSVRPMFVDIVLEPGEILQLAAGTNLILVAMATGEQEFLG